MVPFCHPFVTLLSHFSMRKRISLTRRGGSRKTIRTNHIRGVRGLAKLMSSGVHSGTHKELKQVVSKLKSVLETQFNKGAASDAIARPCASTVLLNRRCPFVMNDCVRCIPPFLGAPKKGIGDTAIRTHEGQTLIAPPMGFDYMEPQLFRHCSRSLWLLWYWASHRWTQSVHQCSGVTWAPLVAVTPHVILPAVTISIQRTIVIKSNFISAFTPLQSVISLTL